MNKTVKYVLNADYDLEVDYEDGQVVSAALDEVYLGKDAIQNLFEALKETFGDFGLVYPPGVRGPFNPQGVGREVKKNLDSSHTVNVYGQARNPKDLINE